MDVPTAIRVDAPNRVTFDPARTSISLLNVLGAGAFGFLFAVAVIRTSIVNFRPLGALVGLGLAAICWGYAIFFWRNIAQRRTSLTIQGQRLVIEEKTRAKRTYYKEIPSGGLRSVYVLRHIGRSVQYEVWARRAGENREFILDAWSSREAAIYIRHFIAEQLQIAEETSLSNTLL